MRARLLVVMLGVLGVVLVAFAFEGLAAGESPRDVGMDAGLGLALLYAGHLFALQEAHKQ